MLLALDDFVALALGRINDAPVDKEPLPPLLTHFKRVVPRLYVCASRDRDRGRFRGRDRQTERQRQSKIRDAPRTET